MYAYRADLYCDACGERIKAELDAKGVRDDGDTDTYPQWSSGGEADSPNHCASDDCPDAIELSDGRKVGALLEEELTEEGRRNVQEAVNEAAMERDKRGGVALEVWADAYDIRPESGELDEADMPEEADEAEADEAEADKSAVPGAVLRHFGLPAGSAFR
jgi:hypothetical protein